MQVNRTALKNFHQGSERTQQQTNNHPTNKQTFYLLKAESEGKRTTKESTIKIVTVPVSWHSDSNDLFTQMRRGN